MEFLSSFANINNFTMIVLLSLIILFAIGIKTGAIRFKNKGLTVGIEDRERRVMQRQTTFIHGRMDAIASQIQHDHPNFGEYRTKWICKCAELEWIRSIHYNHVEDTEGYRYDRFVALRDLVQKKADDSYFFTQEFEDFLMNHVKEVVKQLVAIRRRA